MVRKIGLAKTFDFKNKWRPMTRGLEGFSATSPNSQHQAFYSSSFRI